MLSVIIITYNEEAKIYDCLRSVQWADEIIVVDSLSTDKTREIAAQFTQHVFCEKWQGFGKQKKQALDYANGEWVLSLDADERISDELKQEIQSTINGETPKTAYKMPRRSEFCGRFMRHTGWYPDYVIRLFKHGNACFNDNKVHEKLQVTGEVGVLQSPIIHLAIDAVEQSIDKMNFYSSLAAQQKFDAGQKSSLLAAIIRSSWTFFRGYILRLGILDGSRGFVLSMLNAHGTFYKHVKLMFYQQKNKKKNNWR